MSATNDFDTKTDTISLELDTAGRPTEMIYRRTGNREKRYTPSQLKKGVVLREKDGHELLRLKTLSFNPESGATVQLRYLYSGVPPATFRTRDLLLRKNKSRWRLYQADGKTPISKMFFQANKVAVFGYEQAVGIREIRFR